MEGRYYLVVVEAFSKWPEVTEMTIIFATRTVNELKKLFARYDK
ncbi:unnamed protein product [Haemonchus placei]|uniref:DUF4258 domain-containing protein n=1 Tax=Haemonchus placei TaxID=6290 RepID=A0A0N4W525_HAEPC|nr:unnamed protein product [Haemonchus placei]